MWFLMDNEEAGVTSNCTFESFSGSAMDLDFVDELLYDGCWLRTTDAVNFQQLVPSEACNCGDASQPASLLETNGGHLSMDASQGFYQEVTENNFTQNSSNNLKMEGDAKTESQIWRSVEPPTSLVQPGNLSSEKGETGSGLWIGPRGNLVGPSSVKERLRYALKQLKEFTKERDILMQIWVPVRKGNMNVLTTANQPYFHNPKYKSLASYRTVSKSFQFPADGPAKDFIGLPGRVYLGKMPEETPDVRFFRNEEYPRKDHAKQYNISGSFAVPVFERGSSTCLGVVEVVTTTQKISYRPEIENICQALEAVDLRASQDFCPPSVKACKEFCQDAAPEISQILEFVCRTHCLPLALTWAPCFRQGKGGCRHFDEKYAHSISTVDSACFVADKSLLPFHVACSEQYLFPGQGIVGKAFTTNKQCFSCDITAFSKTEYPFSHHAKLFGLLAAVAIPLRSTYNGPADFVLELFLPKDCVQKDEQKQMWDLLPIAIKETCQSLNVVLEKEPEENGSKPIVLPSGEKPNEEETQKLASTLSREPQPDESWVVHVMDAQRKGKGVCVSLNCPKEETTEPFKVTTDWENPPEESRGGQVFTHLGHLQSNSGSSGAIDITGAHSIGNKNSGGKKRTKTEKTISLQVLRQYFAGSLKDAARSLGVCPTTLKRICRQHGITRWPSRKIKKVGHSLKKLQLVIDSVQGAEGAIQIGSFYSTFPELNSPNSGKGNFSSFVTNDNSEQLNQPPGGGQFGGGTTSSKSNSSSSQSSGSSICCSTGVRRHTNTTAAVATGDLSMLEDPGAVLKRTFSNIELHAMNREETKVLARSQSHMTFAEHPGMDTLPLKPKGGSQSFDDGTKFKVKATYGDDNIRFSLLPDWGFMNFQLEVAKRFNIEDVTRIDLKYLDDDQEWVLLTCDDDLEECKDIYRMSKSRTIKVAVQQASQPHIGSSNGSRGPLQ